MEKSITLSMIVKNEEKYLKECLDSVKDLADEIIIVDTGSTDRTVEIASSFGAKISHFEWCSDFSAARNFALKQSTGRWILYMDADERLHPESAKKIRKLIRDHGEKEMGVRCLVNSIDENSGNPKMMKYTRFFTNTPGISFSGKVHEQIDPSLLNSGYILIDSEIEILHIGYNIETDGIKNKARRNLELLQSEYRENPSSYYEYHLGITYEILGDKENSVKYFSRALEDKNLNKTYQGICFLNLAVYYSSVKYDFAQADRLLSDGLAADPDSVMLNLVASEIYAKAGLQEKALKYCIKASESNKKMGPRGLSSIFGVGIKQDKISYHGLLLSMQYNNQQTFRHFLGDLRTQEKNAVTDLLNRKSLNDYQIEKTAEFINEFNIDFFLFLSEHYAESHTSVKFMLALKKKFNKKYKCNLALGNVYIKLNNIEAAISEFNDALLAENADPSPVFYLASAYVQMNKFELIPELLRNAVSRFGHIPIFMEKLNALQQKLQGVLS